MLFHVPSPQERGYSPGRVCQGEEPQLRSRPVRGGVMAQVTSCQGKGHGPGRVCQGEEPELRSHPVRGGVTAQVTSCQGRGHGSGHGSGHVLSGEQTWLSQWPLKASTGIWISVPLTPVTLHGQDWLRACRASSSSGA